MAGISHHILTFPFPLPFCDLLFKYTKKLMQRHKAGLYFWVLERSFKYLSEIILMLWSFGALLQVVSPHLEMLCQDTG